MDKLFLDANIFFSGVYSTTGASFFIFELANAGKLEIFSNSYVLHEAKINIEKKIGDEGLIRFYEFVSRLNAVDNRQCEILREDFLKIIKRKDAPVLDGANNVAADFLITLDRKDFLTRKVLEAELDFEILMPGDYLKRL